MRKKTVITFLSIFLLTILNGCVSTSHTVSEITDADAISQSLTNTNASMQTGPLTLTVIGENKLLVTLTDDRTNGFLDFDESSTSQRTFNVNFFAKNQQKLSISMTPYSWDLSGSENISKGGVPDFYVSGQKDTYQIAGNTLFFEVNQAGIADCLCECDNYTLYYFDKNDQQEMLAGGSLSDIVSTQKSNEIIKITYIDDNQAIVRLAGETFDHYLNGEGYHNLTLGFYLPGNDSYIPLYELRVSSGDDLFGSKLYQLTLRQSEEIMDSEELIGNQYNNAIRTDSGYSAQIFYGGIESLLSTCDRIVVTDDEGKTLLTESYQNAVTGGEAIVFAIPEVFEANAKDDEFFYPATEDYIVIMLDMPMTTVLDYGYGKVNGIEYYVPINSHESPLKIISG